MSDFTPSHYLAFKFHDQTRCWLEKVWLNLCQAQVAFSLELVLVRLVIMYKIKMDKTEIRTNYYILVISKRWSQVFLPLIRSRVKVYAETILGSFYSMLYGYKTHKILEAIQLHCITDNSNLATLTAK